MKNHSFRSAVFGLSVFLVLNFISACRPRTQQASDVSWGHMPSWSGFLVNVPDRGTIRVCGDDLENLKWAISLWGEAIDRSYNFVESCGSDAQVVSYAPGDPRMAKLCSEPTKNGGGFAQVMTRPLNVVNCHAWNAGKRYLLHEVGHLFGMCDQYNDIPKDPTKCVNQTGAIDPASVMGSADRTDLAQDDIDGIRALAGLGARSAPALSSGLGVTLVAAQPSGLQIASLTPGGNAARKGMRVRDVISSANGTLMMGAPQELIDIVKKAILGDGVLKLIIDRSNDSGDTQLGLTFDVSGWIPGEI